jgi:hypothetical protein
MSETRQQTRKIKGEEQIFKKPYTRKSYHRRSYTKKDGTKVKAVTVKSARIPGEWIHKQGESHGKYGLIDMKDYRHLSTYKYSYKDSSTERHAALKAAIKHNGRNWVVRRLTALSNIRPEKYRSFKSIMKSDVEYVEENYPSTTEKRSRSRSRSHSRKRSKSKSRSKSRKRSRSRTHKKR